MFHRPAVSDSLVLLLSLFLFLVFSVPPLHLTVVLFLLLLFISSFHLPCQLITTRLSIAPSLFHLYILLSPTGFIICSLYLAVFQRKKPKHLKRHKKLSFIIRVCSEQRHSVNVRNKHIGRQMY